MSLIVPAILEQTKEAFNQKVNLVTKIPGVKRIQVDFGDGEFIADRLLAVSEMDTLNPAFEWEAHLMVKHPEDFLDYSICGFNTVIIHQEACKGELDMRDRLAKIASVKLVPGICINPSTPVKAIENLEGLCNHFLVMGVVPGKQGQAFLPEVLEKVRQLRVIYPRGIIEVDGGVNETNIKSIKDAGADLIVAGSAIVKAENPTAAFERLNSL